MTMYPHVRDSWKWQSSSIPISFATSPLSQADVEPNDSYSLQQTDFSASPKYSYRRLGRRSGMLELQLPAVACLNQMQCCVF